MYPVMLNLAEKHCLVVGGGGVALRKVEGLLEEGARVTVVASEPSPHLVRKASEGTITLQTRSYQPGEVKDYLLVFAATDDREVNRQVSDDASAHGLWVNVADDPELCTFHLPARMRRGPLQLAVASGGDAPFLVRRVRQLLERRFGPEWGEWVQAATRFRNMVRSKKLAAPDQERCFDRFFENTVDEGKLTTRVPTTVEEEEWLGVSVGGESPADPSDNSSPSGIPRAVGKKVGFVSLVGAGPGDAGLLTLRGRQRLMRADAVVCDRLAMTALPCDLPAHVELHWVGKQAGNHPVPQEEINALLVRLADQGKTVVRLKGGDPYVFGRGGEEAEVLASARIPFEVIPCVTAAVAVPNYAGVPVTFRREVVNVTMVTAHESVKKGGPQVRWDLLAKDPHGTIIGYMGVSSLPQITEKLLDEGMDPATPAALIERGTTSAQRSTVSTLKNLPDAIRREGLKPPALFVIGPSVRHADKLDWFTRRPLFTQRIIVPAPGGRAAEHLEMAGAEVVETPYPMTPAARVVISALPNTGCLFNDAEQVDAIDDERDGPSWGPQMVAWCTSREAAIRARELGWQRVEEILDILSPKDVARAIIERLTTP